MNDIDSAQIQDVDSKSDMSMRRLVINTILLVLMAMAAFTLFGLAVGAAKNVMIILGIVLLGALILAIRGNPLPGQIFAPLGVLIALLYVAYTGDGGLHDEILMASPLVIVLAGLLLGNRGGLIFGFLTAAGMCIIGLIEISGVELSISSSLTGYDDLFVVSVAMITIALVQNLLLSRLNFSLEEARRNEYAQIRANRELRILQADLENRVNERTMQLNKRAIQLQASSEVGRAVSSINDLNDLLESVTTLISERFGHYHVGVFLLDRAGENAVLRAANSIGGQRMLARGHSLPVGSRSIVGYVTQRREPRVALDVGREATFFDNPDLPHTRSEMALPLIAAGKLLGALDVQSTEAAAFNQEDANVLQVLADQIAIAIENSNLLAESRASLEASRRAYSDLSRQDWMKRLRVRKNIGYTSDAQGNIFPVADDWSGELRQARHSGQAVKLDDKTLAIPFNILDLPAGMVKLKKPAETRAWTKREISLMEAVVSNLGEVLESARLYENTQKRAERERLTANVASSIRENLDVDAVLRTAAIQIRQALDLANVEVRLEASGWVGQSQNNGEQGISSDADRELADSKDLYGVEPKGDDNPNADPKGRHE